MTSNLSYKDLDLPVYRNSHEVFAGLTVSDLAKAAVLGGLNLLLVGDKGTGKTQLASDIYHHYFGGNKSEGGNGVFMRAHPDIDIYNEIFTKLNLDKKQREMTSSLEARVFLVDEINRAPPIAQNQFFGLGDGKMDYQGRSISLGSGGYNILIATANMGNGEFAGTFDTDKALLNRLHVGLDLEYGEMKPTFEDKEKIKKREANPNVISVESRDISQKIAQAKRDILATTQLAELETRAVLGYLEHGLQNCQRYGVKDRVWPMGCQDCPHNSTSTALCSLVKEPSPRTMEVVRLYAESLNYLAKLKNPEVKIDKTDLVFKAFELTGAYQHLLNPSELRKNFGHNPKVMAEVVAKLREDYLKVQPYILSSLEEAEKEGKRVVSFFEVGEEFGPFDNLDEKHKKTNKKIEPYIDAREVGLNWVPKLVDTILEENASGSQEV